MPRRRLASRPPPPENRAVNDLVATLPRRSTDAAGLRKAILGKLVYSVGKDPGHATAHDWFFATALAVRDRIRDAYHRLARCRQEMGDEAAAAEVLERALRVDRTDEEALRGLARLRERRGELGAALTAWRALAALRPEDPAPAREVARLEALKGREP